MTDLPPQSYHLTSAQEREQLKYFFQYLYGNEVGYAYLPTRPPGEHNLDKWYRNFFEWPRQMDEMVDFILSMKEAQHVHHSPALFRHPSALKENVIGARVLFAEFDGNAPNPDQLPTSIPRPSFRLQSSFEGNEHWYWFLNYMIDPDQLERYNHGLATALGADRTWNRNRVLRPPFTNNIDKERETLVLEAGWTVVQLSDFPQFEPAPSVKPPPQIGDLPDVKRILAGQTLPDDVLELIFQERVEEGFRSSLEMKLGFRLAECGLNDEAMFVILLDADARWGKFKNRNDRDIRLMEIVSVARAKHPLADPGSYQATHPNVSLSSVFASMSGLELLAIKTSPTFKIWEGILSEKGFMLVTGDPNVGKTQFVQDLMIHFATGVPFLDRAIIPRKVMMFNLEMDDEETKDFWEKQTSSLSQEELRLIGENVRFGGHGYAFELGRPEYQAGVEWEIQHHGLQGIIIDSLGKITAARLSDENEMRKLFNWLHNLTKKYTCFVGVVHHNRKGQDGSRDTNTIDGPLGSRYITADVTAGISLAATRSSKRIEIHYTKMRQSERPDKPEILQRSDDLRFTRLTGQAAVEDRLINAPTVEFITPGSSDTLEGTL